MKPAIQAVRESNKIAEASMCYTGDILDTGKRKYDLDYYVNLAKELEQSGAHILGIKDMAGLLKPEAAYQLISSLKETLRSEEHTSELQSRGHLVCRLLLEKKKKQNVTMIT